MGSSVVRAVSIPSLSFGLCSLLLFWLFCGWESWASVYLELDLFSKYCLPGGFVFVFDSVSFLVGFTILFISGCVVYYCGFYINTDVFLSRFISVLVLFVLAICCLVFCPGLVGMIVGWDWLGLSSFLLVVYYMNKESLSAGMLTAISNRVGDGLFILGVGLISCLVGNPMVCGVLFVSFSLSVFSGLVVLGSITKSAQMPFSAWLPAAIAAPTPVSALVHSSTLVAAGVYVLVRYSGVLGELPLVFLAVVSLLTVVIAGTSAVFESDLNNVVALSTLSQVSFMMFALAIDIRMVALYHLVNHAFTKALLFLCLGSVIYFSGGEQDGRLLGSVWWSLPLTISWLVVSLASLAGVPFMSCFWSKDLIVEAGMSGGVSVLSLFLLLIAVALTVCYSVRMAWVLLFSETNESMCSYSEESNYIYVPIGLLGVGSVSSGYFLQRSLGEFFWWDEGVSNDKVVIIALMVVGVGIWWTNTRWGFELSKGLFSKGNFVWQKWSSFFQNIWYLPFISGNQLSSLFLVFCSKLNFKLEKGWLENFIWGKSGLFSLFGAVGENVWIAHNNGIGNVFWVALTSVVLIMSVGWFEWWWFLNG